MAIRHVVMWQFGALDDELLDQTIHGLSERLRALVGVVPGLLSMSVSANSVPIEGNWDVILIADLEDEEALSVYAVHPDHLAVAKDIRAVATARAAVDFAV